MLQRHQLLTEFEALFEADKERYAPFEDIIRAAQVMAATSLVKCFQLKLIHQGI
jgi:hypothetical protein